MKNLKKLLAWLVAGVICCSASVGLTVAYLTDRDSEANVFTVGDVRIDLTEDFKQGAWLVPGEKIEKETQIENIGKSDAYVWMTLAIPTALDVKGDASKNIVHWNIPGAFWEGYHQKQTYIDSAIEKGWLPNGSTGVAADDTWNVDDKVPSQEITIKGKEYRLFTFLYNRALKPGEKTNIGLSNVYLDTHIDIAPNGDWHWVENGETGDPLWNVEKNGYPIIYVSAYGIQSSGFDTPLDGYNAYGVQWGEDGAEWGVVPTVVRTYDEFINAGKNPKTTAIILGNDIVSTGPINIIVDADVYLNGYSVLCENTNASTTSIINASGVNQVTIYGEGVVEGVSSVGTCHGITNQDDKVLVLNNVNVDATLTGDIALNNRGVATVNGGKFASANVAFRSIRSSSVLTINDAEVDITSGSVFQTSNDGTIIVNGGTYKNSGGDVFVRYLNSGTIIVNGGTFSEDPTPYVDLAKYDVTESGGMYTVTAK